MASANVGRGGVPEKSADFWGALQKLFELSLIKIIAAPLHTTLLAEEQKSDL